MALLPVLTALREADDPAAPALGWAWAALSDHLDRRYRLPAREHDDVRQRTLLKVLRAVSAMNAETEGGAEAWLRKVHRTARVDHHRTQSGKMMDEALRTTPRDADGEWLGRVAPAAESSERPDDEEAALDHALDVVLERVTMWLAQNVKRPNKRAGDRRRAEAALLANVRGLDAGQIASRLADGENAPSKAAIYKWIERGRENVVLPAISEWRHPVAEPLAEVLRGARRADAGRPRPKRRKAVSPPSGPASERERKKR